MRGIPSSPDKLWADVEGDVDAVNGVLQITKIRVKYYLKYTPKQKDRVNRAFKHHPEKCPAYMTLKNAVQFELKLSQYR